MWERRREGGAGKKPTGWESDLPRASRCAGGRSYFREPEAGWTVSRRTWNVRTGLVSLGCQQDGGNSPGWGLVGRMFV